MIRQKLHKSIQIGGCIALLALSGGASAGSICEGDLKQEGTLPHIYTGGVASVCIKAGNAATTYQCMETDGSGCYGLEWAADCSSVTVTQLVESRYCKGISHTAGDVGGKPPPCDPKKEKCK